MMKNMSFERKFWIDQSEITSGNDRYEFFATLGTMSEINNLVPCLIGNAIDVNHTSLSSNFFLKTSLFESM